MTKSLFGGMTIFTVMVLVLIMVVPVQATNGNFIPDEPTDGTPSPTVPSEVVTTPEPGNDAAVDAGVLALANPVITVWYESTLSFGALGNPQDQINIVGNVSDSDGSVSSLSYRLNGGSSVTL